MLVPRVTVRPGSTVPEEPVLDEFHGGLDRLDECLKGRVGVLLGDTVDKGVDLCQLGLSVPAGDESDEVLDGGLDEDDASVEVAGAGACGVFGRVGKGLDGNSGRREVDEAGVADGGQGGVDAAVDDVVDLVDEGLELGERVVDGREVGVDVERGPGDRDEAGLDAGLDGLDVGPDELGKLFGDP